MQQADGRRDADADYTQYQDYHSDFYGRASHRDLDADSYQANAGHEDGQPYAFTQFDGHFDWLRAGYKFAHSDGDGDFDAIIHASAGKGYRDAQGHACGDVY